MDIIPLNPIDALAKGSMLQVIFFAIMFGFGLSMLGEKGRPAFAFFDACAETMINVTTMVMKYAPISVFGLMTFTVAKHGLNVLLPLGKLLLVMYLAAFLQIILVYLPCAKYAGHGPKSFFSGIMPPPHDRLCYHLQRRGPHFQHDGRAEDGRFPCRFQLLHPAG